MIRRAVVRELDPNQHQIRRLHQYCGFARFVWNWGLSQRNQQWDEHARARAAAQEAGAEPPKREWLSYFEQHKQWVQHRNATPELQWACTLPSGIAPCVMKNLEAAFKRFAAGKHRTKKPRRDHRPAGYPRFKSRFDPQHRRFQFAIGVKFDTTRIRLPESQAGEKMGWIKLKEELELPGVPKTVTVRMSPTKRWYIVVLCEIDAELPAVPADLPRVGLDWGVKSLIVTSEGKFIENPAYRRRADRRLVRLSKRAACHQDPEQHKKVPRSNNHAKAVLRLAKVHERIANRREEAAALHRGDTQYPGYDGESSSRRGCC